MSLTAIKPWFKDRLETLNFAEHVDGFNTDNIGQIVIDRAFHVRPIIITGGPINHTDQRTETDVEVKIFFKGGRDANEAIDSAILEIEQIVKECCNIRKRTSDGLLNVIFNRAEIEPRALDNDNSVLVTFSFTAMVLIGVEE